MPYRRKIFLVKFVYVFIDVLCLGTSIYFAAYLRRYSVQFDITIHNLFFNYHNPFQSAYLVWIFAALLLNNINGLYQTRRELLETAEIWTVIKSVIYSCIFTAVYLYVLKIEKFPRSIFILTGIFITISFSVWRVIKKIFVDFLVRHGYNNFNVAIIGAGKIGRALAEEIKKHPGLGLRVVGFLDDFKLVGEEYAGFKVIGRISDFSDIIRKEFVNKTFITVHHDSSVFLQLLEMAHKLNVSVRVIPQGFEFASGEFTKYNIGFIPVLEYGDGDSRLKQVGKRLFDFVFSSIMILVLLPLFGILTILIKLDSPGPIFYFSQRYGFRGRKFSMWKFRSMVVDADNVLRALREKNEVDGPIFKIRRDPRITKLGRFLRRYSLDELPQIFNVFKGDMSLVGPRPLPIDQIEKEDLRQLKRLEVRPGITGLWQIRGRSDLSFVRLVKWDIWYINNWSFWLDLNILFQTIPVVLKGKGAY